MDVNINQVHQVPSANLSGIKFCIGSEDELEKLSVCIIDSSMDILDPRLGLPNPCGECPTCLYEDCEGHFGVIKLPLTILNYHFLSEVVQILNKICPRCKSVRKDTFMKGINKEFTSDKTSHTHCKYCAGISAAWYPKLSFRVSSSQCYERSAIVVEISKPGRNLKGDCTIQLAGDFWDFIPNDDQEDKFHISLHSRMLTHAQVHLLLKDVELDFIRKFGVQLNSIFLNSFPVTPNCDRSQDFIHASSNEQKVFSDTRTRIYRKLVNFSGAANKLGSQVAECLRTSKLHADQSVDDFVQSNDKPKGGLRWAKLSLLSKHNNHCFRMVVIGDPRLKLDEIGISQEFAEQLRIAEQLTHWNYNKMIACFDKYRSRNDDMLVCRNGNLVRIYRLDELQFGDIIYRPLNHGDKVLINRPPSIHKHSFIALSVKIIPVMPAVAINPLCCQPLYGDFDGDCLHGYIPQSMNARVELDELVALDKQGGECFLSLSQDCLTSSYLILEHGMMINRFQMQQLSMFSQQQLSIPVITNFSHKNHVWSGKELISVLFPRVFDDDAQIHENELNLSGWKGRKSHNVIFQSIIRKCRAQDFNFLHALQEVLCEWLSMRGLSVSLYDLYIAADSHSRKCMLEEIRYGLHEVDQFCNLELLMVKSNQEFLTGNFGDDLSSLCDGEWLCYEKQRSAVLTQTLLESLKPIYKDIQGLCYRYATRHNSLLTMLEAGSKGTLLNLLQHSMCLGLQYPLRPLSFRMPQLLSCGHWNNMKVNETAECARKYIPFATTKSSFLSGLNPLECFLHSASTREASFSGNADIPGTLYRKLMFFLRDLYCAYDGTVRSSHGNHVVQFCYAVDCKSSLLNDKSCNIHGVGGHPVGSIAASAISEVAYCALEHPSSLLGQSPLLSLKKTFHCGAKNSKGYQTMTLFLSENLRHQRYGFEYGALEVKNHLERLLFADIVSSVRIMYTERDHKAMRFSPWVCQFQVYQDSLKERNLRVESVINSLRIRLASMDDMVVDIEIMDCCIEAGSQNISYKSYCIGISFFKSSIERSSGPLETIQDSLIPFLLQTVIRGFKEITKVDILWRDGPKSPKSCGELYLKVSMSVSSNKMRLWNLLLNKCIRIMDMIDWKRSHSTNIHECCLGFGVDAGWNLFVNDLGSSVSTVGKKVLPGHLFVVANRLSFTGEFVPLNSKGLRQLEGASSPIPFLRAFFSNPGKSFIQAAKTEQKDALQGTLEALVWGNIPTTGTGHFEIMYSGKGTELSEPLDVYDFMGRELSSYAWQRGIELNKIKVLGKTSAMSCDISTNDILSLSRAIRDILSKYQIDQNLSRADKRTLLYALRFHPRCKEKIGSGVKDIKVISRDGARCFCVVRADGSLVDFSYHKCIHAALEAIHPQKGPNMWPPK